MKGKRIHNRIIFYQYRAVENKIRSEMFFVPEAIMLYCE
jgi:hypothetical protein